MRKKIDMLWQYSQKAIGMLIENYLSIFGKSMDSFLSHYDHLISIQSQMKLSEAIFLELHSFKSLLIYQLV